MIRKIVAVDPEEHEVMFEVKELLVDPMFERLALEGKRGDAPRCPTTAAGRDGSRTQESLAMPMAG